jgi:putative membrane protein
MRDILSWFVKGFGIGAANVIPGVSGGTIALITGIFERLIDSIKSFNLKALRLLYKLKLKEFAKHTDLQFLVIVFIGALASIFTLARLLGYLFENYPIYVWAYFFGLILASVYFVGKTIETYSFSVIISFIVGTAIAAWISFLNPAVENDAFYYLIICGIVAIVSMILPGLSGSFILILMGNYELVMIRSVNELDFGILSWVAVGVLIGLPAFSNVLSWIYKKYKNETIGSLTGFILGSLFILWPWKNEKFLVGEDGLKVLNKSGEPVISGYERYVPDALDVEVILSVGIILIGVLSVWLIERFAEKKSEK